MFLLPKFENSCRMNDMSNECMRIEIVVVMAVDYATEEVSLP